MSANTSTSSGAGNKVWVKIEGHDFVRVTLEPHTEIIDDLKEIVLGKDRSKYQAFYREQYLHPQAPIPTDASGDNPIRMNLIIDRPCEYFF